ncbi:MAG: AI-2E family transporter [Gammaproteobacteria bacterium]
MTKQRAIIWGSCLIVFLFLFYLLAPVLTPFLVAGTIAYLFDPLVNRLQKLKLPRTIAAIIVFLLLLAIVVIMMLIFIPLLQQQVINLIDKIPDMLIWLQNKFFPWLNEHLGVSINLDATYLKKVLPGDLKQAGSLFNSVWHTVFSSGKTLFIWVANLLLIPVVLFYLLRDWPKFLNGLQSLLPRRNEPTITVLFRECNEVLGAFLRGQFLVMLALGLLYSIGLSIVGLNTSFLIGLTAGLLSIVPYLGFIIGIGAALIAATFQFHDVLHCVYVIIVFVIAQSIEGSVLTPNLVGDRIGLHPVAVIFAVLAGGQLFGFVGILLALPVAAVSMVFLRHFKARYINSRLYRT